MWSIAVTISSLVLGVAHAQVFGTGSCPKITTQKDFELNKYLGDWYEIYKFNAIFENGQACIKANYKLKENGHLRVFNTGNKPDGKETTAEGDGFIPDPKDPARLKIQFAKGAPYGNYWVLDTDYTSYSLIYACTDIVFGISHVEFAWILAREKTISDEIKDKLFKEISDFKINTQNFMKTNQTAVYCV